MPLAELLKRAQQFRQSGNLQASAGTYRQILTEEPGIPDAWRFLGEVYRELGDFANATASFEQAIALRPNDPETLNGFGIALAQRGRQTEAVESFRKASSLAPDYAQPFHNLAVALAEIGELEDSISNFRRAVSISPEYVEAYIGLGNALAGNGDDAGAVDAYVLAVRLRPNSVEALNGLGRSLTTAHRAGEGLVALRQAIRLRPSFAGAHNNLGLALAEEGRYEEAEKAYEQALGIDPRYADAHANLGNTYKEQGQLPEAVVCYDIAAWLKPDCVSARWNRSLALLQMGNFEEGWQEYEVRWERKSGPRARRFKKPILDSSHLQHCRVLVHMEQGLGDTLQFIRYASDLKNGGATVIAECPSPLLKILSTCPAIDRLISEGDPLPEFDCHVPIMSLPRIFGTRLDTIPAETPYLYPDAARTAFWRERLTTDRDYKIGIAWQGNPHHQWDRHRSVPLAFFAPLARIAGVQLISLQRGPGSEQIAALKGNFPVTDVLDHSATDCNGIADTAALMKNLDLVITVDTATAHLAGAIGIPVWVLLSTMVDWRWLLDRDDSPWYSTMRLFRQSERGNWKAVFDRVKAELTHLVEQRIDANETKIPSTPEVLENRPQISLCMIVRDSARTIEACLQSIRPWVDEMVVVDTGSCDATPDLVCRLGARLFLFPWCDDFSAARNESIRHARGEWIFWMDSDDTIDGESGRKLRELVNSISDANILGHVVQVHCPSSNGDAGDVTIVDHIKIFRNLPSLRFEGRIHEQILPAIRRVGGEVGWSDAYVTHSGADHSPEGRKRKFHRDIRLLQLELRDQPEHTFVLFNLGMTHADRGDHESAIKYLARSLKAGDPGESHMRKVYALLASSMMQLNRDVEALTVCNDGLRLFPADPELNFRAGLIAHRLGRLGDSERFYCKAMASGSSSRYFASIDIGISGFKARYNLAAVFLDRGEFARAEQAYRHVIEESPHWTPGWRALIDLLIQQCKFGEAEAELRTLQTRVCGSEVADFVREAEGRINRGSAQNTPSTPDRVEHEANGKLLTIVIGCYGSYPEYSLRALDSVCNGEEVNKYCDVLIGLNECGGPTVARARNLVDAGIAGAVIESKINLNKDPLMRLFIEAVRTPYFLWLDDDSWFCDSRWPRVFAEAVAREHPFDVAGETRKWGPRRDLDEEYIRYIRARPWWRGDEFYSPEIREWIPFAIGGMFIARTDFLRKFDYPDRGMIKGVDDVALGELIQQVGGRLVTLSPNVLALAKINDGKRRGTNFELENGWRPSIPVASKS